MINFRYKFFLLLITLFIVGCSSAQIIPYSQRAQGETEANEELRAYVGDLVYSKYDFTERYEGRSTGTFKVQGLTYNFVETMMRRVLVDGAEGGCTTETVMSQGGSVLTYGIPVALPAGTCFYDEDGNGAFDHTVYAGSERELRGELEAPAWILSNASNGTKKELIYQGVDGDTLRLRYREFIRDIVRPSYDQTVEYNLAESKEITFRGLSFTVIEANNQYLVYIIESGTLVL